MNFNHILFPVDFSDGCRALNREVEWVAHHFGSKVTLLHVIEIPRIYYSAGEIPAMNPECFEEFRSDRKKELMQYPILVPEDRVERIAMEGDACPEISDWVRDHDVDLIMLGTHGHGALRRFLLGSVAMNVLHNVNCPVWTHVAGTCEGRSYFGITKVVCAVELDAEAVPLLRYVRNLAAQLNASVHLIHSVPETGARPYRYFDFDLQNEVREAARKRIASFQTEAGTDFPLSVTDGFIGTDTAALAADQKADLIVIGRGRAQDALGTLRTHSYEIIRQAPCPVLSFCAHEAPAAHHAVVGQVFGEGLLTVE